MAIDTEAPENTAARTALWRALHVEADPPPHVIADTVGLKLLAPDDWRARPDMDVQGTRIFRASIVARARFIEDIVIEQAQGGVGQSAGVSLYLTQDVISDKLRKIATLVPGSTFAMTFILPLEASDPEERVVYEMAMRGAQANGTPFLSMFTPEQMRTLARGAGLTDARVVSGGDLAARYFAGRTDGLRPGSESLLIATT